MRTPTFVILIVCFASIALADDFKTNNGKEYKNASVTQVEADGRNVHRTPCENCGLVEVSDLMSVAGQLLLLVKVRSSLRAS